MAEKRMTEEERQQLIEERQDSEIAVKKANPKMPCKSCVYSEKMHNGRKPTTYMAGSCEKYEIKPYNVYFEGKPCSKYLKK